MKKKRAEQRKMTPKTVSQYLARVPEPGRSTLKKIRAVIWSCVPAEATETISYGIPMFKHKGLLIGYAAFSKHCSLFPTSMTVIRKFAKELKRFESSKGTIRFPLDTPFPAPLLRRMVRARLAEKNQKQ
jgi:uncharacterized protein YdhG (YjbR/CyaY superfamily)